MVKDEDIKTLVKENNKNKGLTKEQKEQNIIEWTTFYRRNLDIFNEDYLGIKNLCVMQRQMINTISDSDVSATVASRGLSKSFCIGLTAIDYALLYSNCTIGITSLTLSQSNLIISEKIERIFCKEGTAWSSPVLVQLKKDGWIKFKKNDTGDGRVVEFGNGSKIIALACGEGTRGQRLNFIIVDEYPLTKKSDIDKIMLPTLEVRKFGGRPSDYHEETKQAFLSSARNKSNWGWKFLVNCVNQHYKNEGHRDRTQYGFFCGDIFTAVANGIQTKNQYLQRKRDTDDLSFEQEYLNIWLSENDNSIFNFKDFEDAQMLTEGFLPRDTVDIMSDIKQTYNFNEDDQVRIIIADIAMSTGKENDNTIATCISLNTETGVRDYEYWESKYGSNTIDQVLFLKRLFYEYKADYIAIDVAGNGRGVFDVLSDETYDPDLNITYPAWNLLDDPDLQISTDTVVDDIRKRAYNKNGEQVVLPISGNAGLNTSFHLSARKNLKNGLVRLLKDDSEMKLWYEDKDKDWLFKSAEEKTKILLPYLQTRYMINEAISLDTVFTENGNIKLKEHTRTDTKDRYIVFAYGNYACDLIYNKYHKSDDGEYDASDWAWMGSSIL